MNALKLTTAFFLIGLITGCSHPIQIGPDLSQLRTKTSDANKHNAGYYISNEQRALSVTTPGGGGDSVTYFPYKDTEVALKTALQSRFNKVYTLSSLHNDHRIKDKNIRFIFTPKLKTESSSSSLLTWPPTDFTIEITCDAYSADGKEVWSTTVNESGHAEYNEFISNFSLSAQRATGKAFKRLSDVIINAKEFE